MGNPIICSFCGKIDGGQMARSMTQDIRICYRCVELCIPLLRIDRSTMPGVRPLSKRQSEIYDFLAWYIDGHGYAPSFEEIAAYFGYTSLATVHEHLQTLERKGWIERDYNLARAIKCLVQRAKAAA